MTTIAFVAERLRQNFIAALAGELSPPHDYSRDVCVCGATRSQHVGLYDTCPSARADSTESFREAK